MTGSAGDTGPPRDAGGAGYGLKRPAGDWYVVVVATTVGAGACVVTAALQAPPGLAWLGLLCSAGGVFCAAYAGVLAHRALATCERERNSLPQCVEPLRDLAAAEVVRSGRQPADLARADDTPAAAVDRTLGDLAVPVLREQLVIAVREVRTPGAAPTDRVTEASPVWTIEGLRRLAQDALHLGLLGGLLVLLGAYAHWPQAAVLVALAAGAGMLARHAAVTAADALGDASACVYSAVTAMVADRFYGVLPRDLANPERRIEAGLKRQLESQAQRLHDLLAEGLVGPSQALADHAGALAQHSAAWGDAAREMTAAASALVSGTQEQIERVSRAAEARALEFADQNVEAARLLVDEVRRANDAALREHAEQTSRALLAVSEQVSAAIAAHVQGIERQVAGALDAFRETLPDAMRASAEKAVDGAVELTNAVRDQAGILAQAVSQVSQNAARQLEAYDRWAGRVEAWQAQLEQATREARAREDALVAGWQERADAAMGRAEAGMAGVADANARAVEGLRVWLNAVVEQMANLRGSITELNAGMAEVRSAIRAVRDVATEMGETAGALNRTTESAARALTVSAAAEVRHASALKEATEKLDDVSQALVRLGRLPDRPEGGAR